MFKVGDKAVHLSHGVGKIVGLEKREFSPGKTTEFYIMEIQDNGAPKKVFIPTDSAGTRLRKVITKQQVDNVYNILTHHKGDASDSQTWNRRYRSYMEQLHTGEIDKIAVVFVELYKFGKEKDLSFGERKLLDQALQLLTKELSAVLNISEEEAQDEIRTRVDGVTTVKLRLV